MEGGVACWALALVDSLPFQALSHMLLMPTWEQV